MLSLGLVTRDYLEGQEKEMSLRVGFCVCKCIDLSHFVCVEIQSRRQERKRRTTANPIYSGAMFEPEVTNTH